MATEYIKFFEGWMDSIETIPDETQRQELALAILRYAFKGEKYQGSSPFVCVMMPTISKAIDATNYFRECGNNGYQKKLSKGATEGAIQGGIEGATQGARHNTNTNTNTYTNTNNNTKRDNKNLTPNGDKVKSPADDFDFKKELINTYHVQELIVNAWLLVRKKKKAVNTKLAIDALVREADKAGITVAEAVQMAAENSWQSFQAQYIEHRRSQPQQSQPTIFNQNEDAEREAAMRRIEAAKAEAGRRQAEKERQEREAAERVRIERLNQLTGFDYQPNNNNNDE